MKIGVIGLGLIGGSICKAIKENTEHRVMGRDIDGMVAAKALAEGRIDGILPDGGLDSVELLFICLHPEQTISFLKEHVREFRKGGIVCDVCGVKRAPIRECEDLLSDSGVTYLGTHPMAGREFSGYDYSDASIFKGASFIITPTGRTPADAVETVRNLATEMKFGSVVMSTPDQHDRNIAYTSQMAHIASNAYVKSPSIERHRGFSAGSFQDLTRVARLNEDLWTALFMMNSDYLLQELELYIGHLSEYRDALEQGDANRLKDLLRDGRMIKEASLLTDNGLEK